MIFQGSGSIQLDVVFRYFGAKKLPSVTLCNINLLQIRLIVFAPRNFKSVPTLPQTLSTDAQSLG